MRLNPVRLFMRSNQAAPLRLGSGHIVTDIGIGDGGKGVAVSFLASQIQPSAIARYNGGPNAGHNVYSPFLSRHPFNLFGSASFLNYPTTLPQTIFVDPTRVLLEAQTLSEKGVRNPLNLITIDSQAKVILPFHVMLNHMREIERIETRGENSRHGSIGCGIWEASLDSARPDGQGIIMADLLNDRTLREKLKILIPEKNSQAFEILARNPGSSRLPSKFREFCGREIKNIRDEKSISELIEKTLWRLIEQGRQLQKTIHKNTGANLLTGLQNGQIIIFEGAQGAFLDETFAPLPFATPSTPLARGVEKVLGRTLPQIGEMGIPIDIIGVTRTTTRHGIGPLPAEIMPGTVPDEILRRLGEDTSADAWQEKFRPGWFDVLITRFGARLNAPHQLFITCLDRLTGIDPIPVCVAYELLGSTETDLEKFFEYENLSGGRYKITDFRVPETPLTEAERIEFGQILFRVKPIYEYSPGWKINISNVRSFDDLPAAARKYVLFISQQIGVPVGYLSVGPYTGQQFKI